MVARRLQCWECGTAFYGRADARYCSAACRQKSHRARARRRVADETVAVPGLGDAIARAREAREKARIARERAHATCGEVSKARAALARLSARDGGEPAPRRATPD